MKNYADIIEASLSDSSSKEKRDLMVQATLAFYLEMKRKIESGDPAQKEEASKKLLEIQNLLSSKKDEICQTTGLSPDAIALACRHPQLQKERKAVYEANEQLKAALETPPSRKRQNRKNTYTGTA